MNLITLMLQKIASNPLKKVPIELRKAIIFAFIFLGPLGALLNFHVFPKATRTYYLILFLFPFFYLDFKKTTFEKILIFFPLVLYVFISSVYSEFTLTLIEDAFPMIRFCLLLLHFMFIVGAIDYLQRYKNISLSNLTSLYLWGYFLTFFFGMALYIGFFLNILSLSFIEKFNILTQYGWGFLRFNPGSYANEYSVTSSFVICLLFLKLCHEQINKKKIVFILFLIIFSFMGMLLATTRTSILAFVASLFYLTIKNKQIRKKIYYLCSFFLIALLFLKMIGLNFISFLIKGFSTALQLKGSVLTRIVSYWDGFQIYENSPILGNGFGSFPYFHNLYLQLLFELGILGAFFLLIPLCSLYKKESEVDSFKKQIYMVGFIHIFTFALTNHNLFHHLTWFIFLIYSLKKEPNAIGILEHNR